MTSEYGLQIINLFLKPLVLVNQCVNIVNKLVLLRPPILRKVGFIMCEHLS